MKKLIVIILNLLIVNNLFSQKIDNSKLDSAILKADQIIEKDTHIFFKNVESLIVFSQGEMPEHSAGLAMVRRPE